MIVCYRLSQLQVGRTTVYGVPEQPASGEEGPRPWRVRRCGTSLLAVLHEHLADRLGLDEWEMRQPWNRGAGSIDRQEVDESRAALERVEALQRRPTAGKG